MIQAKLRKVLTPQLGHTSLGQKVPANTPYYAPESPKSLKLRKESPLK